MICPNCKKEINNEAIFCPYCGFNLSNNNIKKNVSLKNNDSNNKKMILLILVVVVLIGGIVFGISVFMNKKNESNTNPTNNQVENNNENDNSDEHENDNDEGFLMEIFSVNDLNDEEISLEGNVVGGVVRKNDKLEIAGHGAETKTVKVKRIFVDDEEVSESNGNVSTAIVVSSSIKDDISTEQILFNPKFYSVVNSFDADITLYTKEEGGRTTPILGTYTPSIAFYSFSILSTIDIPSSIDMVIPGESANLHVTLNDNMVMRVGSKFKIVEGMKNVGIGLLQKYIVIKKSDNNMILYILKLFFKPITTFKKYNNNLDDSKNCIFLTIFILILMTLGYVFVKAADCVVTYPVWDYGYTLEWKNLFEFSWGYYICKGLLVSLITLFSITTTIFAMSRIFNRNVRYLKLLAIVSSSFIHFTIGVMCIGNLLRYNFEWLSLVMFIVSISLTLLILYEFLNIELALTDNQKIYFNVICLFILVSMLCYVFVKCIYPSSVTIVPDLVG